MASLNKVFLIGNLTRDPEVRYLPSGMAVADLRLAVSRRFKGQNGEDRDETCFVNVAVWGRQGETCGQYLTKGSPLLVEGRLQYEEWEREGQKQSRLRVVAERTQFLSGPRRAEMGDRAESGEPRQDRAERPARPARPAAAAAPPEPVDREEGPAAGSPAGDDDNLPF